MGARDRLRRRLRFHPRVLPLVDLFRQFRASYFRPRSAPRPVDHLSAPVHLYGAGRLGGIAAMVRFAVLPELTLLDYKIVSLFGISFFMLTVQYLCFLYHPRGRRRHLVTHATAFNILFLLLVFVAPSSIMLLVGTIILLGSYAALTKVHP